MQSSASRSGRASALRSALFLAVALALGAVAVMSSRSTPKAKGDALRSEAAQALDPSLKIAALEQRLRSLEAQAAASARDAATQKASAASDEPSSARDDVSAEERERREQERDERVHTAYERKLGAIAAAESEDGQWSSAMAERIQKPLAELHESMHLESLRCGQTLCVLSFTQESAYAHVPFMRPFVEATRSEPMLTGRTLMRRHDEQDGSYRTVMYVARAGEKLPPMDEEAKDDGV